MALPTTGKSYLSPPVSAVSTQKCCLLSAYLRFSRPAVARHWSATSTTTAVPPWRGNVNYDGVGGGHGVLLVLCVPPSLPSSSTSQLPSTTNAEPKCRCNSLLYRARELRRVSDILPLAKSRRSPPEKNCDSRHRHVRRASHFTDSYFVADGAPRASHLTHAYYEAAGTPLP